MHGDGRASPDFVCGYPFPPYQVVYIHTYTGGGTYASLMRHEGFTFPHPELRSQCRMYVCMIVLEDP